MTTIDTTQITEHFLSGGGEMGQLIRTKDWTQTPLGNPKNWPQSLKTCVRIILTSRQPMFVWWGNDLINIYNDAYLSIIGRKHPQALGQPAKEVWKEIWDEVVGPRALTVMQKNEGTYDEALLLIMQRNGYAEETYYTFSYSPVPGDKGGTDGIICANTDDTQKIIGERQLRVLRDLGKNIIDCKSYIEIYRRTMEVLQANPQDFPFAAIYETTNNGKQLSITGKYPATLPQQFLPHTIELTATQNNSHYFNQVMQTGELVLIDELQQVAGDIQAGAWQVPAKQFLLIPIKHNSQKLPYAILGVGMNPYRLLDETYSSFFQLVADQIAASLANVYSYEEERKRAEALAAIDKAKTAFFSNISHEFRTPLTLMLGPIEELLQQEQNLQPLQKANLETTHRNALRLLRLVNSLLDFSRIEAGRSHAQFQPIALSNFTKELCANFDAVMEKAGLQFIVNCTATSLVYVDKLMWEKVLFNLLSNAFKFTLQGTVNVTLSEEEKEVVLTVSDTGAGIPENELPNMFQRFHRVTATQGRSYEGTGIGLSLVNELVHLHKGTITVESKEGIGSAFHVRLLKGKAHLSPESIHTTTTIEDEILPNVYVQEAAASLDNGPSNALSFDTNKPDKKPRILLADDNADMREYIKNLLHHNYEIITAGNGKEAIDLILQDPPDLIISDIMMPVMDGFELLKKVKKNTITANTPVILLSARAGEEAKIEGYDVGADDYLIKPFSAKELVARVRSHLKLSSSRNHVSSLLTNLFMQAPVAMCIMRGEDYIIEVANTNILELWGKTAQQVLHKPMFEAMPEVHGQGIEAILKNVYETGERFVAEEYPIRLIRQGIAEDIFVKFVYEALREEDGRISGIMVIADEVTAQIKVRKRVEESETRLKLAIQTAAMGTYEWMLPEQVFIYSEKLANLFGFARTENLRQKDLSNTIHPDDIDIRLKAHDEAFKSGILFYEARFIWPNGETHWLRVNGKVVFNDVTNEPIKIYGAALDITEHKTIEERLEKKVEERTQTLQQKNEELRISEERYHKMTEEVKDYAILLLDKNGNIINWNKGAEKVKGYKAEEVIGKNISIFSLPEDRNNNLPAKLLAEATSKGWAMQEGYRLRKDGSTFWGSIVITALHDDNEDIIGFSKVTRDLTERKIAEDKLNRYTAELEFQNKELEQFAYVASHDLQEPLRKIQIFSQLLYQNLDNKAAIDKYYSKITGSATRMSDLIRAVLNYSRLAEKDDERQPTNLNDILAIVETDLELMIEEKQAVIHNDELPVVTGIPLQLTQLFYNLIGNSLKFSDKKPSITINCRTIEENDVTRPPSLQEGKRYTEIVFIDNGIGFEQEYAEQLFTIFKRLHGNTMYTGTGIGLALCKKIVDNHSGYLTAKSEAGKGASFFVYLPL